MAARVVTTVTKTNFVFQTTPGSVLSGICVDLWNETAKELNLTYSVDIVHRWKDMFNHFNLNKSDVIMERMNDGQMRLHNISKLVFFRAFFSLSVSFHEFFSGEFVYF